MKKQSRTLGWLAVVAAGWWLYYDWLGQVRRAFYSGVVTLALTAAHIATAKQ